jgi:hypothetical protein
MATATAHPRKGWGETGVAFHSPEHVKQHCDGNFPPVLKRITLRKYSENMASFAKARDELLVAYDEGTIDDEEFVLLWEQNVSKNPSDTHHLRNRNVNIYI